MMRVYLDNAATTPIDKQVFEAMLPYLKHEFGNPSSIHFYGRQTKSAIEQARKDIAEYLRVSPNELFFTSGGTEANNMALRSGVESLGIQNVISSEVEHHSITHTLAALEKEGKINLNWVKINGKGEIDLKHLRELLKKGKKTLVTLMHGNNEIGNLLPLKDVADICLEHEAIFHTDAVQTMGHYPLDFQQVKVHMASCSAHKFHGPKSIGFLYINSDLQINPFIYGGAQERNMRGGTENVPGIIGIAKAFDIAYKDLEEDKQCIQGLKSYMVKSLNKELPGCTYNGSTGENSLYTVLNVSLPVTDKKEMLLFILDIAGIAVSGGSSCSSGGIADSHVLKAIDCDLERPAVRFSFSKLNTTKEIDHTVKTLVSVFRQRADSSSSRASVKS